MDSAPDDRFDVIVVGAGINGSAIARDAAMRGFTVLLLEKQDISSATSAWSSRMIHGGVKYLENYEVDLVRESLHEREWLLRAAPHLVRPLPFLMPFLRRNRRPPFLLRMGMLAYDVLSFDKSLPHHRVVDRVAALKMAGLDPTETLGGAIFYDAQAPYAERLSLENVLSARDHGARVLTHSRVTGLSMRDRDVIGVRYRDELTGVDGAARSEVVVNATGPWADELISVLPDHARPLIGGTKGSHLVVDSFPGAPRAAMYYEARRDGRPVLVIPWLGRYLIGSTDIRYTGDPDDARADATEVDYILSETNELMPGARLSPESIRLVYTGVRPLPFEPDDDVAKITRHHIVHDHAPAVGGLVTIVGGKLTTFRSLAQDAVDVVCRKLRTRRKATTRWEPLPGGRTGDYRGFEGRFLAESGLPEQTARRLLSIYGVRAADVAALAATDGRLAGRLDESSGAMAAEVAFATDREMARTLTDVLMRRTMLGLDPELTATTVERAAEVMGSRLGWTASDVAHEIDSYFDYAQRFRFTGAPLAPVTVPVVT